jgi:hypothetical protein
VTARAWRVPPVLPRGALSLAAALAAGCHHLLEPIQPLPVPLEEIQTVAFPPGTAFRIENGYDAPAIRSLRAEGIHELEIDLRDWTARLIQEIEIELERRGVAVVVPETALAGTSVEPRRAQRSPRDPAALPLLRARVLDVTAPDPAAARGPFLSLRLEAPVGGFAASFTAGEERTGFRDALYDLKKKVLDDEGFQAWIRTACAPSPSPAR